MRTPVSYCLRFLIPEPWKNIDVMVDGLENTVSYEMQNVDVPAFRCSGKKKGYPGV